MVEVLEVVTTLGLEGLAVEEEEEEEVVVEELSNAAL